MVDEATEYFILGSDIFVQEAAKTFEGGNITSKFSDWVFDNQNVIRFTFAATVTISLVILTIYFFLKFMQFTAQ